MTCLPIEFSIAFFFPNSFIINVYVSTVYWIFFVGHKNIFKLLEEWELSDWDKFSLLKFNFPNMFRELIFYLSKPNQRLMNKWKFFFLFFFYSKNDVEYRIEKGKSIWSFDKSVAATLTTFARMRFVKINEFPTVSAKEFLRKVVNILRLEFGV